MKIAIAKNKIGFQLSEKAIMLLNERKKLFSDEIDTIYCEHRSVFNNLPRNDNDLIEVIETLGERAGGYLDEYYYIDRASLKVVEIPDDVEWQIVSNKIEEAIEEKHRVWF